MGIAFLEGLCNDGRYPHVHNAENDLPTLLATIRAATPGFEFNFRIHDPTGSGLPTAKIQPFSLNSRRLVQQDQGYLPLSAVTLLPLGIALGYSLFKMQQLLL